MSRSLDVYFWDVEAVEWDRPILACVVSSSGDEHVFRGPRCLEDVSDFMDKHKGTYLAHYGGGYDVPLLLNVRGFAEIILSGTNILNAREGKLSLRDTFPAWLASLAKVGEAVGLSKMQVDRGDVGGMQESDLVAYCLRDVHVLRRGYEEHRRFLEDHGAPMSWTAGSAAVQLVRALEPGAYKSLVANRCAVEDVIAFLDDGGGRGGRTECWGRGVVDGVTSLDFKSSYPARYARDAVPIGLQEWMRGMPRRDGVFLCRWTWPHRDRVAPALDFSTACGYGDCESWLTEGEIRLFEARGVDVEIVRGWVGRDVVECGQVFADVMFKAKEGTGPARFFSKVFLNSWHGKALEHPIKEHFTRWRPPEDGYHKGFGIDVVGDERGRPDASWFRYFSIECGDDQRCEWYQQPIMGETILGRARVALFDEAFAALEAAGIPVLYCDTDSCHAQASESEVRQVLGDRIGTGIGQLAIEATGCRGYYLGPKAYLLVDGQGQVVKQALKGIPLRSYARGTIDADGLVREARKGEHARDVRLYVFERALSRGKTACLKDGVSTFLRGAHGYEAADGTRTKSRWGRAPQVREVRCSGRGKAFVTSAEDQARAWSYVSIDETIAYEVLSAMAWRPVRAERWEEIPEETRADLVARGHVLFVDVHGEPLGEREDDTYRVSLTDAGKRALASMGEIGPRRHEDD